MTANCGSCGVGGPGPATGAAAAAYVTGIVPTPVGDVPQVATGLTLCDRFGTWKARWAIGRMHYTVQPGLYAVGDPAADSPVLVTANYKMSFDRLRCELGGRSMWLMVLDTNGINVWCAAGKGTFGTDEIVARVESVRLDEIVSHRTLVLPQLGAVGVSAHEVKRRSGFRVAYGPVRAEDLPAFLDAGMEATPEMRRVRFGLADRLTLVPVDIMLSLKEAIVIAVAFMLLSGLGPHGYSLARLASVGTVSVAVFLVAWLGGSLLAPALLPYLPGRAFALKGLWVGMLLLLAVGAGTWPLPGIFGNWATVAAWALVVPAVASFMSMNFTGASTFTSLSGVRREMRVAVPLQLAAAVAGLTLWIVGRFI